MPNIEEYSLGKGQTAESVYDKLSGGTRQSVCDMGRRMAELTVPAVFPPEDYQPGDNLPGNNQSLGAHCVNTLTSHLEFMAFPPGQPIMRLPIEEHKLQPLADQDPQMWSKAVLAMARLEMAHRTKFQTTQLETAYAGYMKLLLVAGNALWKHIHLAEPSYHRPDCYVVKRNVGGTPLMTVHKEMMALSTMDESHVDFIMANADDDLRKDWADKPDWEKEVKVYSCMILSREGDDKVWRYWQEFEGHVIPGTEVTTDYDNPPMWPGWLIPVYGADWGRGYCEEYRGDLYTTEAHSSALNDGASLAALSLLMVKPGSATSIKQVREAKNLSTLPGDAEDLSVFRSDKTADYNFVIQNYEIISRRLSAAFLLQSSVSRNAERVTKEEIQRLGQELDKAMGGLYTQIAQGNQRVIITRAVRLHEEDDKDLPEIPDEYVRIEVITGKDGLGQSLEFDNLTDYAAAGNAAFPQSFEAAHNALDYFRRLASSKGIKPDGLVKDEKQMAEEAQQEQQRQMSATLLDKATGPAVKGMADMMANGQGGQLASPPQQ